MRFCHLAAISLLCFGQSGCVPQVYAYVESGRSTENVQDLSHPASPIPVRLQTRFLVNGVPRPEADATVYGDASQTLDASGVFKAENGPEVTAVLEITVNDHCATDQAFAKGLISGLSFAEVSKTTRDDYEITFSYRDPKGLLRVGKYQHAIVGLVGRGPPPDRGRAMRPYEAFGVVMTQSLLSFLGDLQAVHDTDTPMMFVNQDPSGSR